MTVSSIVVVGAGLGGLRTVEHLRRKGCQAPITLVGGEVHAPYDRPPLTKQVLRGERDSTLLRDELDSLDVTLLLGRRAVSLDGAARTVRLADGVVLQYEALVLAPGAVPRHLPGGFIGCEVAASLRTTGARVDLVEMLAAPMLRVLGSAGAQVVTDLHRSHGVSLHTGIGVTDILGDDHVTGVRLTDGTVLETSDVVVGLGVTPDIEWLRSSGIEITDGIRCTGGGLTSLPHVYALGDAAQWYLPLTGAHVCVEHWTNAGDQAAVVAANIVYGPNGAQLTEVPYFWSEQYDVKIQALGLVDPSYDVDVLEPGDRTVLLYSEHGELRAVVGFSAARWIMPLRSLIAGRASVTEAKARLAG